MAGFKLNWMGMSILKWNALSLNDYKKLRKSCLSEMCQRHNQIQCKIVLFLNSLIMYSDRILSFVFPVSVTETSLLTDIHVHVRIE